jgi:3-deoxy-7-phosphoheptulonate synthase
MRNHTDDLRIRGLRPLLPPAILAEEYPLTPVASRTVTQARSVIGACLEGKDDRLVVVVGPCSIHDPEAALAYAKKLAATARRLAGDLVVVMRVYFEKPRSTIGWKGLINDPHLDGSFDINRGLRLARGLLCDVAELGLPAGCEFLDPISPQFIADLVSWGAIGARTTESQVHRELASGLSMPVGFKNGTSGDVQVAIDAVRACAHPHHFLGVTKEGLAAILGTSGNADGHVILRGGSSGPNYREPDAARVAEALAKAGLTPRVMVDTSHGNSAKDPRRQIVVVCDIAGQIAGGGSPIFGVMIESFLVEGKQVLKPGARPVFGQSVTDACLGWKDTASLLSRLARSVRARRSAMR